MVGVFFLNFTRYYVHHLLITMLNLRAQLNEAVTMVCFIISAQLYKECMSLILVRHSVYIGHAELPPTLQGPVMCVKQHTCATPPNSSRPTQHATHPFTTSLAEDKPAWRCFSLAISHSRNLHQSTFMEGGLVIIKGTGQRFLLVHPFEDHSGFFKKFI